MSRLYNLTPHKVVVKTDSSTITIPSDGDLRLKSTTQEVIGVQQYKLSDGTEVNVPVTTAQRFTEIDETSRGYFDYLNLQREDAVIVSMPVAQFLTLGGKNPHVTVLGVGSGPGQVLRDAQGNIIGTTALNLYHRESPVTKAKEEDKDFSQYEEDFEYEDDDGQLVKVKAPVVPAEVAAFMAQDPSHDQTPNQKHYNAGGWVPNLIRDFIRDAQANAGDAFSSNDAQIFD